jgi:hypothetical protein
LKTRKHAVATLIPIFVLLLLIAANQPLQHTTASQTQDPCDSYGNCLSSIIVYLSSNPDHTLFIGDSFIILLNITEGQETSSATVSWSYNQSALSASIGITNATFTVRQGAAAGKYPITASVTFYGYTYSSSTISTVQYAEVIPLQLILDTRIINLTDQYGNILRNPDGSFYRNDSFCIAWNASFQYSNYRDDISTEVKPVQLGPLIMLNYTSSLPLGRHGIACFSVSMNAGYSPYNLTLQVEALNVNKGNEIISSAFFQVPFAVVQYSPYFTYFTYTGYNSIGTSSYQKEFVILVRYDGNNPGYSYSGDKNTDPITGTNDTGERALVNSYTFSTDGWTATLNASSPSLGNDLSYIKYENVTLAILSENATIKAFTWSSRVQKYYFEGNATDMKDLLKQGFTYLNVTATASSQDFAGSNYTLFNTSYLYQPVVFNGMLVFKSFDSSGNPDPYAMVNITVHNPLPLNQYLISQVIDEFGNDSEVISAFKADLYDAYNETMQLIPFYRSSGTTAFLVNVTSLSMPGSAMPYYNVTVSEQGKESFSYTFNGSFNPLLLSNSSLPRIPFRNFTAEYVDSTLGLAALPLNVSLSFDSGYFLLWQYNESGNLPFLVSQEPGHLSDNYPLLYGQNSTVYVNLEGGGVHIIGLNPGAGYSLVSLNATLESGGITRVWAIDSQGAVLANITLIPTSKGIAPSGYTGIYELLIPSTKNQTISIYTENSWGVVSDAGNFSLTVFSSERPGPSAFLIVLLVIFVYAALLTSWIVQRRRNS